MDPLPRRPLPLILVATVCAILGSLVLLLEVVVGLQIITWDVKGSLLTGGVLALFTLAVACVGFLGLGASVTLWQRRSAGRFLVLGFWVGAGRLGLVSDRSVPHRPDRHSRRTSPRPDSTQILHQGRSFRLQDTAWGHTSRWLLLVAFGFELREKQGVVS